MLKARMTTGPGEEGPQDAYAYPNDLAGFVGESWEDRTGVSMIREAGRPERRSRRSWRG